MRTIVAILGILLIMSGPANDDKTGGVYPMSYIVIGAALGVLLLWLALRKGGER